MMWYHVVFGGVVVCAAAVMAGDLIRGVHCVLQTRREIATREQAMQEELDATIKRWISNATEEQLRDKLNVYENTGNFGGRDAELLARLKAQLRNELKRRACVTS